MFETFHHQKKNSFTGVSEDTNNTIFKNLPTPRSDLYILVSRNNWGCFVLTDSNLIATEGE